MMNLSQDDLAPALWTKGLLLIRLRWLALLVAVIALLTTISAGEILGMRPQPLSIIAILLAVSNILFRYAHTVLQRKGGSRKRFELYNYLFMVQVITDYICVFILIYFAGFSHFNMALLYLPHVILTGIVWQRIRYCFTTTTISLLFTYILAMRHADSLDRIMVTEGLGELPFGGAVTLCVFNTVIFVFVFLLTRILVMEIRRRRDEMIEVNRRLIELDREKQNYTLRATHELKAPFAAIQSYANVILGGYVGDLTPQMTGIMEKIQIRCEALSSMIKNIIQLSNLRTTLFKHEDYQEVGVHQFLERFRDKFADIANARRITLSLSTTLEEGATFLIIPDLFQILVDNLVGNAIQYSHDDSEIAVRIQRSTPDGMIEVLVTDRGIGINAEDLESIFEEHHRCENAAKKYPSGNGMGLAIVREVARLHRGTVSVSSKIDVGSEFIVRIPERGAP
ncbi:MAG: HAMP domain-containing histidine kinase [bacterium]|nr:HAMP domain-containing histidine kinase [bacterium]